MKWTGFASLTSLLLIPAACTAWAASSAADVPRPQSVSSKMRRKLYRVMINAATCWLEVSRQMAVKWEKIVPATGLLLGAINGVVRVFARLNAGFYETVIIAFTTPLSRQPILEPECVFTAVGRAPMPERPAMGGKQAGRFKH